jgi:cytochrome c
MRSSVVNALFSGLILALATSPLLATEEPGPLSGYQPQLPGDYGSKLAAADLERARMSFMRKCSSCHDHRKQGGHGKGPHLWNLMGRRAGSAPGFEFSEGMKGSGHTWNYATLDYYLTDTKRAVPGLAMNFRGLRREKDRVLLIAFLRTLHDNPPPLP